MDLTSPSHNRHRLCCRSRDSVWGVLSFCGMQTNRNTQGCNRSKILFIALLVVRVAGAAGAQDVPSVAGVTNPPVAVATNQTALTPAINQAGTFGVGPLVGEPTGLTMKMWLSEKTAVDAGAAWSFVDPDGFQLHADFLYHKFDLFHLSRGELPLYFGVGGRVKFVEHGDNRAGIRGPLGISYLFPASRFELFAEVAPILDVAPTTTLEWNGGVGLRYYFR